jgi:hypothetical protein
MAVDACYATVPVPVVAPRRPGLPMLAWGEALAMGIDGTTIVPLTILEVGHSDRELLLRKWRRRADRGSRSGDQGEGEQGWD